jgi:cyclopropane-fatty-acyl-phospholipid synthase
MWYLKPVYSGIVPDWLLRWTMRASICSSNRRRYRSSVDQRNTAKRALIEKLRQSPIAIQTDAPNEQHYEVPTSFFQLVLGKRLKYSCCYWPEGVETLDEAEEAMLTLTCQRARLEDGMEVLDLGCGWGSLSLWIGEQYPRCRVMAVSNSRTQVAHIRELSLQRGLTNVHARVANVNHWEGDGRFDRVLSVEMFEHMKNYQALLARIATWLKPAGLLFVHVFSHREFAYEYDRDNPKDWMAQTFFSGGTMPSDDLLLHFQRDLHVIDHWRMNGIHYGRTLGAWLERLDRNRADAHQALAAVYGLQGADRWIVNWRLFFMGCEQVWRLRQGQEYLVSHYLFAKRTDSTGY